MSSDDQLSRRGLFGILGGRKRVQSARSGVSGLDPLSVRADRLFNECQYAQAASLYKELIAREPEHLEARHRHALCLMHSALHTEARASWGEILKRAPDDPMATLYQGLSHAREGSVELAVAIWRRYKNYRQIELQREINLIVALADDGRDLEPADLVERIETALAAEQS